MPGPGGMRTDGTIWLNGGQIAKDARLIGALSLDVCTTDDDTHEVRMSYAIKYVSNRMRAGRAR